MNGDGTYSEKARSALAPPANAFSGGRGAAVRSNAYRTHAQVVRTFASNALPNEVRR